LPPYNPLKECDFVAKETAEKQRHTKGRGILVAPAVDNADVHTARAWTSPFGGSGVTHRSPRFALRAWRAPTGLAQFLKNFLTAPSLRSLGAAKPSGRGYRARRAWGNPAGVPARGATARPERSGGRMGGRHVPAPQGGEYGSPWGD